MAAVLAWPPLAEEYVAADAPSREASAVAEPVRSGSVRGDYSVGPPEVEESDELPLAYSVALQVADSSLDDLELSLDDSPAERVQAGCSVVSAQA